MKSEKSYGLKICKFECQITFAYLVIGFLWIFLSDTLFDYLIVDKHLLTQFNIAKGFFYMIATSFLLFFFVKRQMNKLKKAKEKAEESNRLKSAFLANMSHEIRTPMNGILGFAELLQEQGLTGEEQQAYLRIIEKSGNRMLDIINDLVDISKIESGMMSADLDKVNINDQLDSAYAFFKPEVESKGLQLVCKMRLPIKEAVITTDSVKSYSILINLLKNAIKFTNEGLIEFGCEKKGAYLEFFVKDTGVGIPKYRQKAVFERFIQADISDKMARQGAGLGLSISKAYAEMLGGKIWLESEEGQGTISYFTLPYKDEMLLENIETKSVDRQWNEPQIRNLKILIAEDDDISARLIEKEMKIFSREILEANNGVEAVDLCHKNPDIDLIMMDLKMPVMNGIEAIKEIRQFDKKVIIIAQTAYALSGDRELAIDAGSDDYISKPIMKNNIYELIQKHFCTVSEPINNKK